MPVSAHNEVKRFDAFLAFAWGFACFLSMKGYAFGVSDQTSVMIGLMKMLDASFLGNNWYATALLPHDFLFNLIYARLSLVTHMSIPVLYFASYCLSIALCISSLHRLCRTLFGSSTAYYFVIPAVLLWHINAIDVSSFMDANHYRSSVLAMPMALWVLIFFLENKPSEACAMAGCTTFVHVAIGVNIFAVLACALLTTAMLERRSIVHLMKPLFLYATIAATPLAIILSVGHDESSVSNAFSIIDYLRFRASHHYFASSFRSSWVDFFSLMITGAIAFRLTCRSLAPSVTSKLLHLTFAFILGCCMQFIGTEVLHSEFITRFSFYRTTMFLAVLAVAFTAHVISIACTSRFSLVTISAVVLFFLAPHPLFGFLFFCLISTRTTQVTRQITMLVTLALAYITIAVLLAVGCPSLAQAIIHRFGSFALLHARLIPLVLIVPVIISATTMYHRRILIASSAGLAVYIALHAATLLPVTMQPYDAWTTLCSWVKTNTPKEASFITPPQHQGFMLRAERQEIVDFKAFPEFVSTMAEWKKRLEDVTGIQDIFSLPVRGMFALPLMKQRYQALDEKQIALLGEKYGTDYVIFEKPKELTLPVVYENDSFILYRLTQ